MKWRAVFLLVPSILATTNTQAADVIFQSTAARTHLLELFTSEGCSSCPPADRWLSQLRGSPRLWKEIVPIGFHVDYWDGLGWPDRFASPASTARQGAYAMAWGSGSVYTPAFVLDGQEWRGRAVEQIATPKGDAGILAATIRDRKTAVITYRPSRAGKWEAHAAVLGLGESSSVKAGENGGRTLLHDFVALSHEMKPMTNGDGTARAEIALSSIKAGAEYGVAFWVTEAGRLEPVQAVGGNLAR